METPVTHNIPLDETQEPFRWSCKSPPCIDLYQGKSTPLDATSTEAVLYLAPLNHFSQLLLRTKGLKSIVSPIL